MTYSPANSTPPICPRCSGYIPDNKRPGSHPGALSRVDNKTEICTTCGVLEAVSSYITYRKAPE